MLCVFRDMCLTDVKVVLPKAIGRLKKGNLHGSNSQDRHGGKRNFQIRQPWVGVRHSHQRSSLIDMLPLWRDLSSGHYP